LQRFICTETTDVLRKKQLELLLLLDGW
jgi:hypothetical protein